MKQFYILIFILLTKFTASAQIISFPDENFKARLLQPDTAFNENHDVLDIDPNHDGEIESSEIVEVFWLDVSSGNISDLTGISNFSALKVLVCNNNSLTSLDLGDSLSLRALNAAHNTLNSINVHLDQTVGGFDLSYNNLTAFDVESANYSDIFDLSHNQLTSLEITDSKFDYFNVSHNNITSIEVNGTVEAHFTADFRNNQFAPLDLSNFDLRFSTVYLGNNPVDVVIFGQGPDNIYYSSLNTYFDLGGFSAITDCDPEITGNLVITDSPNLSYFSLKNGFDHTELTCNEGGTIFQIPSLRLDISNCPELSFICVDESEKPYIENSIEMLGLQNQIQVNSYCSFTPGGQFYTVKGQARLDLDLNGCNDSDIGLAGLNFNITNGPYAGSFRSDSSGIYRYSMDAGSHTITPQLENPGYFTISPASVVVDFPAAASPFIQNFCVVPNGAHPDLEVVVMPIDQARPGFDSHYKIIFKNKGTMAQSGTVFFSYDEAVLDFISSDPVAVQNPGSLQWAFTSLMPFETREIEIVLNVNSPTETPAVNSGDILYLGAEIAGLTDETPSDNTFVQTQMVVNSFDPNDKTCLQGDTVGQTMIGQYVHYRIRFENTGTFAAQNIVVTDMIDVSKFNVATLVPLSGSHAYATRITGGNKVEFIFEGINLPFDDANNDGYVAFKIKLKPNLVMGDSFTNQAEIYFDYNFPVVTEPATTAIQALSSQDFDFAQHFNLYPNPTKSQLNIVPNGSAVMTSYDIFDAHGRQIMSGAGTWNVLDVSLLSAGIYLLKVSSNNGAATVKFLKQ